MTPPMTTDIAALADDTTDPTSADVIDYFGDRQICDHCGATISTYGDKCSVRLDVRCEGFETYERMLTAVRAHLEARAEGREI